MSDAARVFRREEKKYLISSEQYAGLMETVGDRFLTDKYGLSTVCSVYYDTPDFLLIRRSLEKPVYKEKLRLRSYGVPSENSRVFLELKKKYKGIVYKRREELALGEAESWLSGGEPPGDSQIMREIGWVLNGAYGKLVPAAFIACSRAAVCAREDPSLRLTFDGDLRYRTDGLSLAAGDRGAALLPEGRFVMEIKTALAVPLWLSKALDRFRIYPASFSKYGKVYQDHILPEEIKCLTNCSSQYLKTVSRPVAI
ncbi:MAG: polyphosphate polymerase domain-containing protein [Clostridiales bacterium]|nr:polyphosphate polymerase domain-containing protein [Clostridiales bacterium]